MTIMTTFELAEAFRNNGYDYKAKDFDWVSYKGFRYSSDGMPQLVYMVKTAEDGETLAFVWNDINGHRLADF